jgi:hypothetical protein
MISKEEAKARIDKLIARLATVTEQILNTEGLPCVRSEVRVINLLGIGKIKINVKFTTDPESIAKVKAVNEMMHGFAEVHDINEIRAKSNPTEVVESLLASLRNPRNQEEE